VDHLPELIGSLNLIVLGHRKLRAEEEVADRVLVEHAMDEDAIGVFLKVDAMVAAAVAVQGAPVTANGAEVGSVEGIQVGGKDLELGEQVELEILREGAHLGGADGVEDNLEHGNEITVNQEIIKSGKKSQG
jgi:hypothetical protein